MDAVLKMPMIGIGIVVPWRRILSVILLIVCCVGLYVCGLNQANCYEGLQACNRSVHHITVPQDGIPTKNVIALAKMTADSAANVLAGKVEESISLSSVVSETEVLNVPGTKVSGPSDELKTKETAALPNVDASALTGTDEVTEEAGEVSEENLELSGFICNPDGYITGYTDEVSVMYGILVIPTDERCTGIRKGALDGLGEKTTEIYIPANISDIEPGVFDGFTFLFYVEVAADNPSYYSSEGILYTRSGEIAAYPNGRLMAGIEY